MSPRSARAFRVPWGMVFTANGAAKDLTESTSEAFGFFGLRWAARTMLRESLVYLPTLLLFQILDGMAR